MKNFRPDKLVQQRRSDWLKLGGKLVTRIIDDSDNGISQDGSGSSRDFESYSYDYAIKKQQEKQHPKEFLQVDRFPLLILEHLVKC
jgi:hypothetical protein